MRSEGWGFCWVDEYWGREIWNILGPIDMLLRGPFRASLCISWHLGTRTDGNVSILFRQGTEPQLQNSPRDAFVKTVFGENLVKFCSICKEQYQHFYLTINIFYPSLSIMFLFLSWPYTISAARGSFFFPALPLLSVSSFPLPSSSRFYPCSRRSPLVRSLPLSLY